MCLFFFCFRLRENEITTIEFIDTVKYHFHLQSNEEN